jgi:hypothetical protein
MAGVPLFRMQEEPSGDDRGARFGPSPRGPHLLEAIQDDGCIERDPGPLSEPLQLRDCAGGREPRRIDEASRASGQVTEVDAGGSRKTAVVRERLGNRPREGVPVLEP